MDDKDGVAGLFEKEPEFFLAGDDGKFGPLQERAVAEAAAYAGKAAVLVEDRPAEMVGPAQFAALGYDPEFRRLGEISGSRSSGWIMEFNRPGEA
jgi:hypothetical protein